MPYEETFRPCRSCGRATWHGRDVPETYRSYWLAVASHLLTVYSDWCLRWKCLDCGRKARPSSALASPKRI